MTNTLWKCEQFRAGQMCNKILFNTEKEAAQFMRKMLQVEPDIFWRMEPVPVTAVWN